MSAIPYDVHPFWSPLLDSKTGVFKVISNDHSYIHDGKFFEADHQQAIDAAASFYISIKTPATNYVHYRNERVSTSGDKVTIELYEAGTVNAGAQGTTITPVNHNRVSSAVAAVVVKQGPTVTGAGTRISQTYIGGGTGAGNHTAGSQVSDTNEFVLKQDTLYLVKITNGSSASNTVQINLTWYEENA